jgi:hypothetical protein
MQEMILSAGSIFPCAGFDYVSKETCTYIHTYIHTYVHMYMYVPHLILLISQGQIQLNKNGFFRHKVQKIMAVTVKYINYNVGIKFNHFLYIQ